MKKHEFIVNFEDKYYNIVRSIVDNFRDCGGSIRVLEEHAAYEPGHYYTSVWFRVGRSKLNYKLCREVICNLEEFGIIRIMKES